MKLRIDHETRYEYSAPPDYTLQQLRLTPQPNEHQTVLAWSLVALAVSGGADMVSVVIRQTLVQLDTPDAMRGRVSAVNSTFIGASNELGEFRAGTAAEWMGPDK